MESGGRSRTRRGSEGFTLVEVMVAMALSVLVGSTALVGLSNFAQVQDRQGTADAVVSVLRSTAQRSLSEGRTYCVAFDSASGSWEVWRRSCSATGSRVQTEEGVRGDSRLAAVSFTTPVSNPGCPIPGTCVYFYPRGTASPGALDVEWDTGDITVTVEGLSSRVARS